MRCPHQPVLQKERPTLLPRLTPGPGQGEWLADDWMCSLRQGRLARAWSQDPDSVPSSFSLLQIVAQDSWESSFFLKFKPSEGTPQQPSG